MMNSNATQISKHKQNDPSRQEQAFSKQPSLRYIKMIFSKMSVE